MDVKQTDLRVMLLDFMDELCPAIISLCDTLRDYDLTNITVLADICEGLQALSVHAGSLNTSLSLGLDAEVEAIKTQLTEILEATENSDYLFIADILEFDVVENMEKIYNAVRDA